MCAFKPTSALFESAVRAAAQATCLEHFSPSSSLSLTLLVCLCSALRPVNTGFHCCTPNFNTHLSTPTLVNSIVREPHYVFSHSTADCTVGRVVPCDSSLSHGHQVDSLSNRMLACQLRLVFVQLCTRM